jgi:hypothetical protein
MSAAQLGIVKKVQLYFTAGFLKHFFYSILVFSEEEPDLNNELEVSVRHFSVLKNLYFP